MREFHDDSKWYCDICLSAESEDSDLLTQCDLCMVVVHPTCYRRDLYENEDMKDDDPWFCARCKYLIDAESKSNKHQKPPV